MYAPVCAFQGEVRYGLSQGRVLRPPEHRLYAAVVPTFEPPVQLHCNQTKLGIGQSSGFEHPADGRQMTDIVEQDFHKLTQGRLVRTGWCRVGVTGLGGRSRRSDGWSR